jgi:hypothetical protein
VIDLTMIDTEEDDTDGEDLISYEYSVRYRLDRARKSLSTICYLEEGLLQRLERVVADSLEYVKNKSEEQWSAEWPDNDLSSMWC